MLFFFPFLLDIKEMQGLFYPRVTPGCHQGDRPPRAAMIPFYFVSYPFPEKESDVVLELTGKLTCCKYMLGSCRDRDILQLLQQYKQHNMQTKEA